MSSVSDYAPASRSDEVDRNLALLAYGLLFVGVFCAGLSALAALAIAYARRRQAGALVASHHRFQIFIFWVGFVPALLSGLCFGFGLNAFRHAGLVLTHHQLLKEVWGGVQGAQPHYLRVYMAQLRQKMEADPARPRFLITEPGVGYRLRTG